MSSYKRIHLHLRKEDIPNYPYTNKCPITLAFKAAGYPHIYDNGVFITNNNTGENYKSPYIRKVQDTACLMYQNMIKREDHVFTVCIPKSFLYGTAPENSSKENTQEASQLLV